MFPIRALCNINRDSPGAWAEAVGGNLWWLAVWADREHVNSGDFGLGVNSESMLCIPCMVGARRQWLLSGEAAEVTECQGWRVSLGCAPGPVAMPQRVQTFLSFQDKSEILIFM